MMESVGQKQISAVQEFGREIYLHGGNEFRNKLSRYLIINK